MIKIDIANKKVFSVLTLVILALTLFAYSNIFKNELVGDDIDFISNWSTTHNLSGINKLLGGDLPPAHIGTYRPIRSLFYLLTYQFWSNNVFLYHTFSIAIHLIITYLVILNVKTLSKNAWIGLVCGLLFGLHPIHTEAVTFITASFDTIAFAFLLFSFYQYQLFKIDKKEIHYKLSIVFAILSFFTNEQTLILPLLILGHDYFFAKLDKKTKKQNALFFLAAGFFVFVRFGLLKITTRGELQFPTLASSIFTSLKAFLKYLQSLTFPTDLSIAHTLWGDISTYTLPELNKSALLSQKISDTSLVVSIIISITILVLIYKLKDKYPLLSFSMFWIVITLLPVLNILPSSLIFAERYAYFPSIGFVLLLTVFFHYLLLRFIKSPRHKISISLILLATISTFYFYTTYNRNKDWQNETIFWESAIKQNINNPTVYFQLAKVHHSKNKLVEAKIAYKKTTQMQPNFTKAYFNLGLISESENDLNSAVGYYQQALELDPKDQITRQKLAILYTNQADSALDSQQLNRAAKLYAQALSVAPGFSVAASKLELLCDKNPEYCQ